MNHSYAFDIADAGQWTVDGGEGGVKVDEGLGDADVTISTSEDVFMRIVSGEQNPTTAYMTGKMKVKGDMSAAMKLSAVLGTGAKVGPASAVAGLSIPLRRSRGGFANNATGRPRNGARVA